MGMLITMPYNTPLMSTFTDSLAQPGGKLQAAIIRNPLTISLDSNLFQVVELMNAARSQDNSIHRITPTEENLNSARASCVVVMDDQHIAGIITEHDIVKLSLQQIPLTHISVQSCLSRPVLSLLESDLTDIFLAINLLQFQHIQQIPVLSETDQLVGLITQESMNYFAQSAHLLKQRTAAEAMTTEMAKLSPSATLLQVAQLMVEHKTSTVILIEEKGQALKTPYPVGILTERDLVQFQSLGLNFARKCAWEVMSQPVISVSSDTSLWDTQRVMEQKYIQRVLVTGDRNCLNGLITQENLVHALSPAELYKLTERQEQKILKLEQEKTLLLIDRARDLDHQVQERTKELLAKDESYETLAHQTPVGIFRTNLEGKCIYANHEWCNITGIEPDQLQGVDWLDLACAEYAQMLLKEWVLCLQSNRSFVLDFRVQHRQGHTHWVICRMVPEINMQGDVTSYLGCFTAINELKQKKR
ncbi:MAG: CBS domain-containing protein [Acaryochloridaceae cyanobacterium RL_2_7]|nr:CBS domain-containing protein [Acaryochloridaceae cyanobacterium RL_2_7]